MTDTPVATLRYDFAVLAMTILGLAVSYVLFDQLPDPMPTHWNLHGQADGWTSQPWGAMILPILGLGIYAGLRLLPYISPNSFSMHGFTASFLKVCVMITALVVGLHILLLWRVSQGGSGLSAENIVCAISLLLIGVGNYVNKASRNFFFGIRTPWTLANDEVWAKTNRLGGWALTAFGAGGLVLAMWLSGATLVITVVTIGMITVVAVVLYSYLISRRLET